MRVEAPSALARPSFSCEEDITTARVPSAEVRCGDAVDDLPSVDFGAYGVNDACAVAERDAAVEPALADAVEDQEVAVVEARCLDPDADLRVGGFGLADFGSHQATGTS